MRTQPKSDFGARAQEQALGARRRHRARAPRGGIPSPARARAMEPRPPASRPGALRPGALAPPGGAPRGRPAPRMLRALTPAVAQAQLEREPRPPASPRAGGPAQAEQDGGIAFFNEDTSASGGAPADATASAGGAGSAADVAAGHLRLVHSLLWERQLAPLVPPAERAEVVRALGGERQLSVNASLWDEVEALASILGECDARVEEAIASNTARRRLAERPARDAVEGEIRMLVRAIQMQANGPPRREDGASGSSSRPTSATPSAGSSDAGGTSGQVMLGLGALQQPAAAERSSSRERQMLEYVLAKESVATRPSTAGGSRPTSRCSSGGSLSWGGTRPNTGGSSRGGSRPGTGASGLSRDPSGGGLGGGLGDVSVASLLSEAIDGKDGSESGGAGGEHVAGRLGVESISSMATALRTALEEERECLEQDVVTLTEALEASTDALTAADAEPPELDDLRQYRGKLEASWREEELRRENEDRMRKIEHMVAKADLVDGEEPPAVLSAPEGPAGTLRARSQARKLRSLVLGARDQ